MFDTQEVWVLASLSALTFVLLTLAAVGAIVKGR